LDESGNTVQSTDYYPFGAYLAESTNQEKQPYKYNGKEFDHFAGLNLYDYGARFYDPLIGRFTTPDPLSEKYYSISPYAYCANNPVNAVDLRGDSITTIVTSTVNGVGTNTTYIYGQDAEGNYGFFDSSGQIYSGEEQFVTDLTTALEDLRSGSKGNALVEDLMGSTNTVQIGKARGSQTNAADPNGKYIIWDSNSTMEGPDQTCNTTRPAYIGLGHEMAHIQDVWNGTYDASVWTAVGTKDIPNAEKYATHIENQLKSEQNISLRTHYSPGVNSTRILRSGTNQSLYYKKNVTIRGVTVSTTPYIY